MCAQDASGPLVVYGIREWNDVFETRQSRGEVTPRHYLLVPTDRQRESYAHLVRTDTGLAAYGLFICMCRISAMCPLRGILLDDKGPYTIERLAIRLMIVPATRIAKLVKILMAPPVQWIYPATSEQIAEATQRAACPSPPRRHRAAPAPPSCRPDVAPAPPFAGTLDVDLDLDVEKPPHSPPAKRGGRGDSFGDGARKPSRAERRAERDATIAAQANAILVARTGGAA